MDFNVLKQGLNNFTFQELRADEEDYFEGVITRQELVKLTPVLEGFFGPPVSPEGDIPPAVKATIEERGGIMSGQTLYVRLQDNAMIFAMLWPWGSGSPVTIKIGKK